MVEQELLQLTEEKGWDHISAYQKLSEEFIEKYSNKVSWNYILKYQELSDLFIEKYINSINWHIISVCQNLSEEFIERYYDKVYWNGISAYQKLSEGFIEKYYDKVDWVSVSIRQKLSEEFIEKHSDKVYWYFISECQKLSEEFIEKHSDKVYWPHISKYQELSEEFLNKYNLQKPENSWLYVTKEEKLKYIKENTNYEVIDDEYIIAYKSIRYSNHSVFNFQYKYEVGGKYYSHCDCSFLLPNSFGLSAWTKIGALNYYDKGKLLKVKILIEKIGIITFDNKIRCFELEVLEEIDFRNWNLTC